jgi:predicted nucleotidyltransferase
MGKAFSDNVAMLMRVVGRLGPLLDRFVFLGGVVTELFVTEPGAPGVRQTKDVDLVVDVLNRGDYSELLREELVAIGLAEDDRPGAPICRWRLDDMIIDIMPTRGDILGFSSEWHRAAFDSARPYTLPNGMVIRLVSPACFLATKLAAFRDRGSEDPLSSHDLEDVITVIDGRREIGVDVAAAPPDVRAYVAGQLEALMSRGDAAEMIAGHLMSDVASQSRQRLVAERIRDIIGTRSGSVR